MAETITIVRPNDHNAPLGTSLWEQTVSFGLAEPPFSQSVSPLSNTWHVHVKPNTIFFISQPIDCTLKVGIRGLKISPGLKCDKTKLFTLAFGQKDFKMADGHDWDLHLEGDEDYELGLRFNSQAILDILPSNDGYAISFSLAFADGNGKDVLVKPIKLNIKPKTDKVAPEIRLDMQKRQATYSRALTAVKLGEFAISNPCKYSLASQMACEVELIPNCADVPDAGTLITLAAPGTQPISPLKFKINSLGQTPVTASIYANVADMGNPARAGKTQYELLLGAKAAYAIGTSAGTVQAKPEKFIIDPNYTTPELAVLAEDKLDGQTYDLTADSNVRLQRRYFLTGEGFKLHIPVTLRNFATQGPGLIAIRNFTCEAKAPRRTKIVFANANESMDTLVKLVGPANAEIKNGPDAHKAWDLVFNCDAVRDIYVERENGQRNYDVNLSVTLTFEYCLDENDLASASIEYFENNKQTFQTTIKLPVHQQPNPKWLAIDFGTSAIVAQYDDQFLDLRAQKEKLQASGEDTYEAGSMFLSSNLIFRNAKSEQSGLLTQRGSDNKTEDFGTLAVCLSPKSAFELANIESAIPCLKLIVGYDLLPNINEYNVRYNYLDASGALRRQEPLAAKGKNEYGEEVETYTPLAHVDTIFSEVYKQLFAYYIKGANRAIASKLNQLVITVPNNYTPYHLKRIRQIVADALSDSNLRNIVFVSESDAVACYYQQNWYAINQRLGREKDTQLQQKETVLVYDMGAGTLDLTLFKKETDGDQVKITVLGKYGLSKAGNYLDCLLAQIMSTIPGLEGLANFAFPDAITDGDRLKSAMRLKAIIKNEIKPLLSEQHPIYTFKADRSLGVPNDVEIDVYEQIKKSEGYRQFMYDITVRAIFNFFYFFFSKGQKCDSIDTVILSGRSTKLQAIQNNLKIALEIDNENFKRLFNGASLTPDAKMVRMADFSRPDTKEDKSKTVVAEGAIHYASLAANGSVSSYKFVSSNIMANYGVIYTSLAGEPMYCELLNPRKDAPLDTLDIEGATINTYASAIKTLDLSGTSKLRLIQSFSLDPLKDWKEGNMEYLTMICEINVSALHNRKEVKLQLKVDEQNAMTLDINSQERNDLTTSKIDIDSRSTKMSLWPMLAK